MKLGLGDRAKYEGDASARVFVGVQKCEGAFTRPKNSHHPQHQRQMLKGAANHACLST